MTIDEVIAREQYSAEANREMADTYHTDENIYLKEEEAFRNREDYHRQLAEWLRELKAFHDAMDIIPTTPFDVDLGEIPINNRSYDDIVKCLMIAYERGKNDTLSLIEQYILEEVTADGKTENT